MTLQLQLKSQLLASFTAQLTAFSTTTAYSIYSSSDGSTAFISYSEVDSSPTFSSYKLTNQLPTVHERRKKVTVQPVLAPTLQQTV